MIMNEYYFTFGVQYPREPHPIYDKANGDGWVVVEAENEMGAWQFFFDHVAGAYFSTSYTKERFNPDGPEAKHFFPLGEIERFKAK